MKTLQRLLTVLALAVSVVVGSSIPASATFSDSSALPTLTVGTATVAPPGNVVGGLVCGRTDSTLTVTWTASSSARVSGYRVVIHWSDGYETIRNAAATATSFSEGTTTYNVTKYSVRYSVTTLTDYGWFTQSGLTGSFQC